jgi:hypothetical protein
MNRKPSIDEFREVMSTAHGNISEAASLLRVSRQAVHKWVKEDPEFKEAVDEHRKRLFDECLGQARILALGLPKIKDGKLVGWIEKPDGQMLRFFLQTLGRDEGFGNSVDITSNGEALPKVINLICDTKAEGPSAPADNDGE